MENLGDVLKNKRLQLGLTLRQVEEKTGISNAYLSQLENQRILQPTPAVLRKIADLYDISYTRLLKLAGHPVPAKQKEATVLFRAPSGLEEITKEEQKELLEYLMFLRMRRPKE